MTDILTCVRDYFLEKGVSYYKKMQHTGYLRHLLLRRGVTTGEILIHLVTTSQEEHDLEPLKNLLLELPLEGKIVGIMHIINDSLSDVVKSDETRILYGQDWFYETLLGLRFKISTFSFFSLILWRRRFCIPLSAHMLKMQEAWRSLIFTAEPEPLPSFWRQ